MLADLVFAFDSSSTVGVAGFAAQTEFACGIVRRLEAATSGSNLTIARGLRVASVVYSVGAEIAFDFHQAGSSADTICASLSSIPYVPEDFTRLHTAFEIVRKELNIGSHGFRGATEGVTSELVIFTNGNSLNSADLASELRLVRPTTTTSIVTLPTELSQSQSDFVYGVVAIRDSKVISLVAEDSVKMLADQVQERAPCADLCGLKADIVFILDGSTSIEEASAGGSPGNFHLMRELAAATVDQLRYEIANDDIRVSALTFANSAKTGFTLDTLIGEPDLLMYALRMIGYDHALGGDILTDSNLADAFKVLRNCAESTANCEFGIRGNTVPLIAVVLTDGKVRNEGETAVEALEAELIQIEAMDQPGIDRIAFGIGSSQNVAGLQMIVGGDGVVLGTVSDHAAVATLVETIAVLGDQCADTTTSTPTVDVTTSVLAVDTSTPAATTPNTATPTTEVEAPPTTVATVDVGICTALVPNKEDGCTALIAAVGCNTDIAKRLCKSTCEGCIASCHIKNGEDNTCIRCKDGLYLNPFTGLCIDGDDCPEGTTSSLHAARSSMYGRACVTPGATCDDESPTFQCNPPGGLGACKASLVPSETQLQAKCLVCKPGHFLFHGVCYDSFKCDGDEVEHDRTKRCNCNRFAYENDDGDVDKSCGRCKIFLDGSKTTGSVSELAATYPKWLKELHEQPIGSSEANGDISFQTGLVECLECRKGTLYDAATQACISAEACAANLAIYQPKQAGGSCEAPFACVDGVKSTSGESCQCARRSNCVNCDYNTGNSLSAQPCNRCKAGKLLWKIGNGVCISERKCIKKGGIAFQIDGVATCTML
jgi:hypothetical protein